MIDREEFPNYINRNSQFFLYQLEDRVAGFVKLSLGSAEKINWMCIVDDFYKDNLSEVKPFFYGMRKFLPGLVRNISLDFEKKYNVERHSFKKVDNHIFHIPENVFFDTVRLSTKEDILLFQLGILKGIKSNLSKIITLDEIFPEGISVTSKSIGNATYNQFPSEFKSLVCARPNKCYVGTFKQRVNNDAFSIPHGGGSPVNRFGIRPHM